MNQPAKKNIATSFNPVVEAEILASLSGRLAHDCNNAMAGILAVGEDFQFHLEDGVPFPEGLKLLRENVMRTKALIQRIVELPDKSSPKKHHNLNDVATEAAELARKFSPRTLQVETSITLESLPVYVDAAALRWLLIELAWTATTACSQSGKLCFTTSRQLESTRPGVCLKLTATGETIPPGKSFGPKFRHVEPFVENHGAIFSIEKPGASFRLWLPESNFTESEDI